MAGRAKAEIEFLKNLGDFNNIRITVGWEDDAKPGESDEETVERVWGVVDKAMEEKIAKLEE